MGLSISNEDSLKQRWINSGQASFFPEPEISNVSAAGPCTPLQDLMQRQLAAQCLPKNSRDEPQVVEHFRNLNLIGRTPVLRYGNTMMEFTYKGVSSTDGIPYTIHRITSEPRCASSISPIQTCDP